ncbi:hypothetical protein D3C72_2184580 [compost metagenome]
MLIKVLTAPKPNINGTVPMLKKNIESAPAYKLPVPKAYNCMVCNGPHGIKPFIRPTKKGPFCLVLVYNLFATNLGILIPNLLSPGKMLSILIPIIKINVPDIN